MIVNSAGSRSDTGCVREHNEDSLVVQPPLYAVADGMGGHAAGEVASAIAIQILTANASLICNADTLIDTVRKINRSIIAAADNGQGRPGMGTTLTAAILDGSRLLIAQVGDSRAYLLHDHKLQQLTHDHSYVGELLAGGHISASEAASHPKRSVITRALGSDPKTEADIYELQATPGDRLLICSDGLYGMVSGQDIAAILNSQVDPQAASDALVIAARAGGGLDNITVIVVDILSDASEFLQFSAAVDDLPSGSSGRGKFGERGSARGERGSSHHPRRWHLGIITFLVVFALLVAGAIGGVWYYASNSAFLRSDSGYVAVYRGLPGEVLPGVRLEWLEYETDIRSADLLTTTAERLESADGIAAGSLNEAAALVASYERQIAEKKAVSAE